MAANLSFQEKKGTGLHVSSLKGVHRPKLWQKILINFLKNQIRGVKRGEGESAY